MVRSQKFNVLVALLIFISGYAFSQTDVLRILPLGNSLTYGYYDGSETDGNRIGYRKKLYDLLKASGYNFDLVGHQYTGYLQFPDAENGGTMGVKDDQLADIMKYGYYYKYGSKVNVISPNQPYLNVYPADVILLHIGTNDWINDEIYGYQLAVLNNLFNAIDDYETSRSTEVLVIVAKIITKKNFHNECSGYLTEWRVEYYNNELSKLVNARITAGDKIKLIDMQCDAGILYYTDMLNDYHPRQAGYDKMGQHWFNEINNIHNAPVISTFSFEPKGQGETFGPLNLDNYVADDYTPDADIAWTTASTPVYYNVSVNSSHVLTVTPKNPDWTGTEKITFVATDKGKYIQKLKKSASIEITFNTIDINTTPVIISQLTSFNPNEDTPVDIFITDLEVEDDDPPANLTLHIKPGPNYTFSGNRVTPAANYDQPLYVNVTVSDLENESEVFQVLINYNPVNDAPVISGAGVISIQEDHSRTITLSDLVYTDPDNTAGELTLYVLNGTNYTVSDTQITPALNYHGTLSVGVRLRDLSLYSNTYSLTVIVNPVNDPPVITSVPKTETGDGSLYQYQLVANDPDIGDEVSFVVLAKPGWLSFIENTGLLSGTPSVSHIGIHHIIVGATDGTLTTEQAFDLKVVHYNSPPVFTSDPDTFVELNTAYNWKVKVEDADDDDIRLLPLEIPYFLDFLSENGYLIGTPVDENMGAHAVRIGASDGQDTTILDFLLYVGCWPCTAVESLTENHISLYPNPASTIIYIVSAEPAEIKSLKIYNIMGGLVHEENSLSLQNGSLPVDISGIPEGSYILQLNVGDTLLIQRFVKSGQGR